MLNATERKALTLSAFAAACMCFAPGEIISGTLLLAASGLLWRWDEKLLRREAEEKKRLETPRASPETEREAPPPAQAAE